MGLRKTKNYFDIETMNSGDGRFITVTLTVFANYYASDNIYTLLSFIRLSCNDDREAMQHLWNEYLGGAGEGGGEGELEYAE